MFHPGNPLGLGFGIEDFPTSVLSLQSFQGNALSFLDMLECTFQNSFCSISSVVSFERWHFTVFIDEAPVYTYMYTHVYIYIFVSIYINA